MRTTMRGATVVAVALLLGACGPDDAHPRASTASPDATTTSATAAPGASARLRAARAARGYVAAAAPTGIDAPSIGLHVDGLVPLDRLADGTIAVPPFGQAGWWVQGPKPGQRGPAVLLGHVDTKRGPDVFYRLRDLRPGDPVSVRRADGSVVRFTVQRVAQFPKVAFPSAAVYAPSLEPVLRLVTCGGSFDRTVGHYRDNIIAFATLASP